VHDTIASVFVYIVWNVPVKQNEDLQGLHFVKRVCRYFAQRDVYVFALPCVCIALRSSVVGVYCVNYYEVIRNRCYQVIAVAELNLS